MGGSGDSPMTFDDVWIIFFCIAGFGAGVYWFIKGFAGYREYRFLADTPELPIGSIPMGLVHIHGKAWSDKVLSSPVTRTPCLFYTVEIERWSDESERSAGWRHYLTDSNGVEFFLQDKSGKVRIDAHGAKLDLPGSYRCRTGLVAWVGGFMDLLHNWKTLLAPHSLPAPDEDLRAYVGSLAPPSGGDFRLTESCLLPGRWYDLIGTCVENPNAKDERERNMIVKGENDPTYFISYRSEQALESSLRSRAIRQIFVGAGLSIVCAALILSKLRWL